MTDVMGEGESLGQLGVEPQCGGRCARDLRYLGWKIAPMKRKNERGRVKVLYKLVEWKPWPEDPSGWIRDFERERAARNKKYRRDGGQSS